MSKKTINSHFSPTHLLFLLVIAICIILFSVLKLRDAQYKTQDIKFPTTTVHAQIADSDSLREHGLSDRNSLNQDSGMLFIFPTPGIYAFWMKDMRFSLDFIWIYNSTVVDVTENVPSPKTKNDTLDIYTPKTPVNEILEVNAGFIQKHNIKIGDKISR